MFPISKVTALIKKWILFFIFNFQRIKEIFYVGSSEALPPPLSLDEEENLIRRLEKGDL